MKKICLFIALALCFSARSQDYRVSSIPDSLLKDADAVKRYEELHVIIKSIDKAVVKHVRSYTILNENGESFAYYSNTYDKFRSINDISGKMFDANGKLMKSIRKKDISDMSVSDGESMISDARTKRFAFYNKVYPYTVEFEDEETLDGIFSLPRWYPVNAEKLALQKSVFIVETPSDYQIRYKQFNYTDKPSMVNNSHSIVYHWEIANRNAIVGEPFQSASWHDITPAVFIAPTDFEYGGFRGNMSSWSNLGDFVYQLCKGRDELPENIKREVHRLSDHLANHDEKVKVLYDYLQQNTRYIGIQLGIGGYQPFEAKYVAEKKYGDCKALSNYMVSLLKEAGIKANCVLIFAGDETNELFEDFPLNHFDHMIACVPDAKDTIWLECTSQTVSAGYMGISTGNRKALLITDHGGYVVRTPTYRSSDNLQLRKVDAVIDENGNLVADVNTHFTGVQQDQQHYLMYSNNKEQRAKYLNEVLSLPTYSVDKNDYQEIKGKIPCVNEHLKISSPGYASVSGRRMFILPNLFNRTNRLADDRPRVFDVNFSFVFKDADTIIIKIPPGYKTEAMPKDVHIANKFGTYSIVYSVSGDVIKLLRVNEQTTASFPATDYPGLVSYYEAMYKADRSRIVLVKNE